MGIAVIRRVESLKSGLTQLPLTLAPPKWKPFVWTCVLLLGLILAASDISHAPRTRDDSTVAALSNGSILLIGGTGGCFSIGGIRGLCSERTLPTAERFDPMSGQRTPAGQMITPRSSFTATTLRGGRVLVVGGVVQPGENAFPVTLATVELYDPVMSIWTEAAPMRVAREFHTATLLADGRVLVSGGTQSNGRVLADAEIYDPIANRWQSIEPMHEGRWHHTATLLATGQVLVAGGDTVHDYHAATAELYDPVANSWYFAHNMATGRTEHTAIRLPSGEVLITGGLGQDGLLASTERYDPVADQWVSSGSMSTVRFNHAATLLLSGQVLVTGGGNGGAIPALATADLYDPPTNRWQFLGQIPTARSGHTTVLLPTGQVVLAGGYARQSSVDIYDPTSRLAHLPP